MEEGKFELFDIPARLNDSGAGSALYYVGHITSSGGWVGVMDNTRKRAFSNLSSARAAAKGYRKHANIDGIVMVDQTGQCMFNIDEDKTPKAKVYSDFGSW